MINIIYFLLKNFNLTLINKKKNMSDKIYLELIIITFNNYPRNTHSLNHWLETSSRSLYLLTLFLNTCLTIPLSDLVRRSLSSIPAAAATPFTAAGELSGDTDFCLLRTGRFFTCSLGGAFLRRKHDPPILILFPPNFFLIFPSFSSPEFRHDDDEFDEFCASSPFSTVRHQLHTPYDSAFGYKLLQYLCWDLNWQSLHLKSSKDKPWSPHMQHSRWLLGGLIEGGFPESPLLFVCIISYLI